MLTLVALISVAPGGGAWAKEAVPMAEDPALEQRLFDLSEELRCLVCQNQTLAESDAELAQDLRREIRDMMKQGKDDAEIIDFLVQRYGDFVLYRPPFKATTVLLWFGPLILIAIAAGLWVVTVRRRRGTQEAAPLSAEEAQRLKEMLK
jgi:cytochrome c-type biogenesis protein CcmH